MAKSTANAQDVTAMWNRLSAEFQKMSREEKRQTFVSAGLLTEKGNVRTPYKRVIIPISQKAKAK